VHKIMTLSTVDGEAELLAQEVWTLLHCLSPQLRVLLPFHDFEPVQIGEIGVLDELGAMYAVPIAVRYTYEFGWLVRPDGPLLVNARVSPRSSRRYRRFARLLRARHPLITICTVEEDRALEAVVGACVDGGRPLNTWSAVRGVYEGIFDTDHHAEPGTEQPGAALRWCWQAAGGRVFLFCDLAPHLGNEVVVRALRELVARCATLGGSVVLVDHQDALPEIIRREAVPFAPALPDDQEILQIIRDTADQAVANLGSHRAARALKAALAAL
jgi:hypothetical protein